MHLSIFKILFAMLNATTFYMADDGGGGDGAGGGDGDGKGGDGDGKGGDGDGKGGGVDDALAQLKAEHEKQMAELREANQKKVDDVLGQLKAKKDQLAAFDGFDPEMAQKLMSAMTQQEDQQLIKDGKFKELIEKHTEKLRATFEGEKAEWNNEKQGYLDNIASERSLRHTMLIDDALRKVAVQQNVLPKAIEDVVMRGREVFSVNDDNEIVALDKDGHMLKKEGGGLVTPESFIQDLKTIRPHYWPGDTGSGSRGTGDGGNGEDSLEAQLEVAVSRGDTESRSRILKEMREASMK